MSKSDRRLNILTLVDGLPTKENPYRWIHVIGLTEEIARNCRVIVVSPRKTCWPFERNQFKRAERGVCSVENEGKVVYYEPIYFDLPRFARTISRHIHITDKMPRWVYHLRDYSIYLSIVVFIIRVGIISSPLFS